MKKRHYKKRTWRRVKPIVLKLPKRKKYREIKIDLRIKYAKPIGIRVKHLIFKTRSKDVEYVGKKIGLEISTYIRRREKYGKKELLGIKYIKQ